MVKQLLLILLLYPVFALPVRAVRGLPPGVQPEQIEGEAVGNVPVIKGTGTLTFINSGGDTRLVIVCGDLSEERARVKSLTCKGIDAAGTFSGGPNGIAVFNTESGEMKFQLTDGKVFSYSTQGFSMDLAVTDPSIFDDWVEDVGARDSGARVSDLNGQVEIACPPDLEAWDVMKMGRIIYVDCHIKTGEDSKAVISFSDMTTFEMRPETEIVIDTPPEKESKWSLLAGNVWVNVKQMVKDGTMSVHTSQAVAGIKGTTFILTDSGTESKIEVVEGMVNFQSRASGKEVIVSSGESVTATSNGLSDKITFDAASAKKNWQSKNDPIEKKLFEAGNLSPLMTYFAGAGVIVVVVIALGLVVLRKRKQNS